MQELLLRLAGAGVQHRAIGQLHQGLMTGEGQEERQTALDPLEWGRTPGQARPIGKPASKSWQAHARLSLPHVIWTWRGLRGQYSRSSRSNWRFPVHPWTANTHCSGGLRHVHQQPEQDVKVSKARRGGGQWNWQHTSCSALDGAERVEGGGWRSPDDLPDGDVKASCLAHVLDEPEVVVMPFH